MFNPSVFIYDDQKVEQFSINKRRKIEPASIFVHWAGTSPMIKMKVVLARLKADALSPDRPHIFVHAKAGSTVVPGKDHFYPMLSIGKKCPSNHQC